MGRFEGRYARVQALGQDGWWVPCLVGTGRNRLRRLLLPGIPFSWAGTLDLAGRASSALLAFCDMVVQEGSEERVGTNGKEEERVNGAADQGDEEQEKEESATDSPEEAELELDR